jgi:hypothetical protein
MRKQLCLLGLLASALRPGACEGNIETRIVGGAQAGQDKYPYFILWEGCAATLIHEDVALSAAHVSTKGQKDLTFFILLLNQFCFRISVVRNRSLL